MKIATVTLKGISTYSQSHKHNTPKEEKEGYEVYEERIWREKMHVNRKGNVCIPPMALCFGLHDAASLLRMRIPGKGQSEYGKVFRGGVIVPEGIDLGIKPDDVRSEWFSCHANGVRGSGKRVDRCFPMIDEWEGTVQFYVLNDEITEEVFELHLREAGNFIGIGRFRPQNGGFNGRFIIVEIKWSQPEGIAA